MKHQVGFVVKSVYFQLRYIGKIRNFLDQGTSARVVNAMVASHLDLNNGLVTGLS
jgi:hypothetical protein